MSILMTFAGVIFLAAHLLAMNVLSAAPLLSMWLHASARRGDSAAGTIGRQLASLSIWMLAIGTILGVLIGGLLWLSDASAYWRAVARFPAQAYGFAFVELAFSALCLALYVSLWRRWSSRPWLHASLAVLATTNLLYHFPPLMIVLGQLAARPELAHQDVITRPVFRAITLRPYVLAQVMHFVVASVAVAGVALMLVARRHYEEPTIRPIALWERRWIIAGARVAVIASLIQLPIGVWLVIELPGSAGWSLMRDDWFAGALFLLSVLAVFALLHSLAGAAFGDTSHAAVRRSAVWTLVVVLLMTAMLSRIRIIEASRAVETLVMSDRAASSLRVCDLT